VCCFLAKAKANINLPSGAVRPSYEFLGKINKLKSHDKIANKVRFSFGREMKKQA
jgi:HKD family nuclease